MRIAMVGDDFDFSAKDGISRYAYELYVRLRKSNTVSTYISRKPDNFVGDMAVGLKRYFYGVKISEPTDIVHVIYPNAIYPVSKAPRVVTWHDASIFERHKTYNPLKKDFYHWLGVVLPALKNTSAAAGVIYPSEEAKRSVESYVRGLESKLSAVIHEGIDDRFINEKVLHNKERKDFIYVGSLRYPHKNIPVLLDSFARASKGKNDLYLFTPTSPEHIDKAYFKAKHVHIIVQASTEDVLKKLKTSIAMLHLSMLEGFGLPILEAMAVGTPVVVLKGAQIPEAVARYAIKSDERSIPKVISQLAREKPELSDKAIAYAKSFSWDNAASKTVDFYKEAIKRASR
ncbi:MAG: glycosyltransferase [Candidatus Micrarchaeia archaeon]